MTLLEDALELPLGAIFFDKEDGITVAGAIKVILYSVNRLLRRRRCSCLHFIKFPRFLEVRRDSPESRTWK